MREIYTNIPPAAAAGAVTPVPAGPAAGADRLIICDALEFKDADGASGFVTSFRTLRLDEGQKEVTTEAKLGDASTAFQDHDQSFVGYAIQGAMGAELAASQGARFYSVSVFGPNPGLATARAVLTAMMAANG
jgi:hypothetical protein